MLANCLIAAIALAYTQTSIWDLETESVPFLDTSYRPSLFWHLQYFIGWGETLPSHDEKAPSQARLGFSLVR